MIRQVTKEEKQKWDNRVEELYNSLSPEDQIVAILMDLNIGHSGEREEVARTKAKAILERFKQRHDIQIEV